MVNRSAVALAIVVAVPGAAAWASATEDRAPTIHACVDRQNGQLRIVSPGEPCRRHESALEWNSQGDTGPAGAQGEMGPAGAAGAPGISGWEQKTAFGIVAPGATGSALVRCSPGKQVIGGGFASPGTGISVLESHPASVTGGLNPGWIVWARNAGAADTTLTVYALCALAG
jgi:hypothetical protein